MYTIVIMWKSIHVIYTFHNQLQVRPFRNMKRNTVVHTLIIKTCVNNLTGIFPLFSLNLTWIVLSISVKIVQTHVFGWCANKTCYKILKPMVI